MKFLLLIFAMITQPNLAQAKILYRVQMAGGTCTGELIDRQLILTAGHCLRKKVLYVVASNNPSEQIWVNQTWTTLPDNVSVMTGVAKDMGVLLLYKGLDNPISKLGVMTGKKDSLPGYSVKSSGQRINYILSIHNKKSTYLTASRQLEPGFSGSGAFVNDGTDDRIVGIDSASDTDLTNRSYVELFKRITDDDIEWLRQFIPQIDWVEIKAK